jgi:periplasmic protein TonB
VTQVSPRSHADRQSPSIADAVLATGAAPRRPARLLWSTLAFALAMHVGAWFAATRLNHAALPSQPSRAPDLEVALDEPPAPPPLLEPPPPTAAAPPSNAAPAAPKLKAAHAARAPAQAGAIIARDNDPNAPVDLSADAFVTGTASAYAGGVTASSGTSTHAVSQLAEPLAPPPPPAAVAKAPLLTRPVELSGDEWQCPWPREAEAAEIDEQTVTLRVRVDTAGRARSVSLLADPGSGFGAAARTCALQTRFSPALDREGNPVVANSPPIRVRFTR